MIARGAVSRRLAVAGAVLVLSACGGVTVTTDPDPGAEAGDMGEATAYAEVDGVETWDLTGAPSDAAFGIEGGSSAAIYETPDPRPVRVLLAGRTVELEADLLDFRRGGSGDYTFRVSSPQLGPEPLAETFRDVLDQLGLDAAVADRFARRVATAPADRPAPIEVGVGEDAAVLGQWSVAPAVTFTPLAGLGRVVLAGGWPPL